MGIGCRYHGKLSDMDIQVFRTDEQGNYNCHFRWQHNFLEYGSMNDYTGDGSGGTEVQETDGFGSSSWKKAQRMCRRSRAELKTEEMVWISATGKQISQHSDWWKHESG